MKKEMDDREPVMDPKPSAKKAALEKKKRQSREALGNGLAGRAVDAMAARRKRMDEMLNQ